MKAFAVAILAATFGTTALAASNSAPGSICKPVYESQMPSGYVSDGDYVVQDSSLLVTCPITRNGFYDFVDRVDVVTSGISGSDASFVRCWATGATDSWAGNRNYFLLEGSNIRSVTCLLLRHDRIEAVSWFN